VLSDTETLVGEVRWVDNVPRISAPEVRAEESRLRASGFLFVRGAFDRPVLAFVLDVTPSSLQLTLSHIGGEVVYIE